MNPQGTAYSHRHCPTRVTRDGTCVRDYRTIVGSNSNGVHQFAYTPSRRTQGTPQSHVLSPLVPPPAGVAASPTRAPPTAASAALHGSTHWIPRGFVHPIYPEAMAPSHRFTVIPPATSPTEIIPTCPIATAILRRQSADAGAGTGAEDTLPRVEIALCQWRWFSDMN